MHLSNIFKVSITAVLVNKTRTLLTSLGIIIGVASVILLVSIGTGIRQYVTNSFNELGTDLLLIIPGRANFRGGGGREQPGSASAINNKLTLKIAQGLSRNLSDSALVSPIMTSPAIGKFGSESVSTNITGVEANYQDIRKTVLTKGRFFNSSETERKAKVAIIGDTLVKDLFGAQDPINQELVLNDRRYKVIGVLESKGSSFGVDQDNLVIVPISTLQEQLDTDKVGYIYVKVNDPKQITSSTTKVKNFLIDRYNLKSDEFDVTSSQELLKTITGILSTLTVALGGIAAISLVVGGIGIMNIMLVSVTERTREIGLRKAVGAKPSDILIQFLIEAVVLSVIGGVAGILLGSLGALLISRFIQTSVTLWSVLLAFGFSSLVGIVFGVWPARKASRLSPIEALRYE